ncbi:hypothetical protein F9L16_01735 [Agarivorans sp. B2Z047]|uniref:hypothetical protein n=1 Tax=Agarivorans sp. B2Z047 TaxID=2652721 RepID=UPI00128CBEE9|nr:hypothetical protein [Agarivorans sp. B2Z047]MPW27720.1 hypothetical protein [Agarivorans sp. B2Z047]UQN44441.1 hypothetical protein LQZ07_08230 [Agarivorans sp. B2Z047]
MKPGLKLTEQSILNMASVIEITTFEDRFHIFVAGSYTYSVVREEGFKEHVESSEKFEYVIVSVNEYHRIQRELSEYLGVEVADYVPEPEVSAQ